MTWICGHGRPGFDLGLDLGLDLRTATNQRIIDAADLLAAPPSPGRPADAPLRWAGLVAIG